EGGGGRADRRVEYLGGLGEALVRQQRVGLRQREPNHLPCPGPIRLDLGRTRCGRGGLGHSRRSLLPWSRRVGQPVEQCRIWHPGQVPDGGRWRRAGRRQQRQEPLIHLVRVCRPLLRLLGQELPRQTIQVVRYVVTDLTQRLWWPADVLLHELELVVALEDMTAG